MTQTPTTQPPARSGFVRNPRHLDAIRRLAGVRVTIAAGKVSDRVRVLLNEPGLGERHGGEPNPPSLPGDPPTSQSGELAESQTARGPKQRQDGVAAASGSDLPRSLWLQIGTARIEPRPYMNRALLDSKAEVLEAMKGTQGEGGAQ